MKNKSNIFLVVSFCAILISSNLLLLKESNQSDKNKKEVEFPKLIFPNVYQFGVQFDKYYKENFGGKNSLVKLHSAIQYHILKSSPLPKSVVFGEDGWLFLGNKYSNIIHENIGLDTFSKNDLDKIGENIQNRKEYLEQLGIKYYVCAAPNKHTIYNNYLPSHLQNRSITKLEQLKRFLKTKEFELIDLKDYFHQYDTLRLFHKTNTHWNDIGAFLGYKRLISAIQEDFESLKSFELNDFHKKTLIKQREDLTNMIKIDIEEEHIVLKPKERFQSIELEKQLTVPENYFRHPDNYEYRYKGTGNLKVLVFRDSFSTALRKFMKEYFGEIVFVWHHDFNKEIIEAEKPDIVIYEVIERDIDRLKK